MSLAEIVSVAALLISALLAVWVFVQNGRINRLQKRLNALTVGAGSGAEAISLADILSSQGNRIEITRSELVKTQNLLKTLEASVNHSVQHVGLVRYNPFGDTGGDQSFALALLDAQGNGIVMSSLHGRTGTRFYAKPVRAGASNLSLSDEEVQALNQATKRVDKRESVSA